MHAAESTCSANRMPNCQGENSHRTTQRTNTEAQQNSTVANLDTDVSHTKAECELNREPQRLPHFQVYTQNHRALHATHTSMVSIERDVLPWAASRSRSSGKNDADCRTAGGWLSHTESPNAKIADNTNGIKYLQNITYTRANGEGHQHHHPCTGPQHHHVRPARLVLNLVHDVRTCDEKHQDVVRQMEARSNQHAARTADSRHNATPHV
jgi:hypothetical protein